MRSSTTIVPEARVLHPRLNRKKLITPSATFPRSSRAGLLFVLFLFGTLASRCDGLAEFLDPYQLPVRGLSQLPDPTGGTQRSEQISPNLLWTLNVGILNDSELPELAVADIQPLLEEVSNRLKPLLPGVEVRFIVDQPMNSVFLIERSVRRKGFLGPKYNEDGSVLLLGPGLATAEKNRIRLREIAGLNVAQTERELAQLADLTGSGCVSEKLPASEYVWRAYLAGQVRYDLVLTNALIYADDLTSRTRPAGHRIEYWNPDLRFVRQALVPMAGRSALEGYGAYVSVYAPETGQTNDAVGRCPDFSDAKQSLSHVDVLTGTIFQLLRPADFSISPDLQWSARKFLTRCGADCEAAWEIRRQYLKTLLHLEEGGGEAACELLESYYTDYEAARAAWESTRIGVANAENAAVLNTERAGQYSRNHTKFRRLCGKNE